MTSYFSFIRHQRKRALLGAFFWQVIYWVYSSTKSRDNVVGTAIGCGLGHSSSPGRVKDFLSSTVSRPALGPTQSPIQWVPEAISS
jgi:hypothetical protein